MPAAIAAFVVALAGCSAVASLGAAAARPAPFPECDTDNLAFFAENTTLGAIGLDASTGGGDANRRATVWVTAEPVAVPGDMPPGARPPPPQRWLCAEFDDGSGMAMTIDDTWQPSPLVATAEEPGSTMPVGTVVVAIAATAVAAVSYLAFRGGER